MQKKIVFSFGKKKPQKNNLKKGLAIGTVVGTTVGAIAGILFAPKSGKETRELIKDEISTTAKKAVYEIKEVSDKAVENAKKVFKKSYNKEDLLEEESQPTDMPSEEQQEVK